MIDPRSNPPYFEAQIAPQKPTAFPNKTNGNPRKIHNLNFFLEGPGFDDRWVELLAAGHL